MADSSVSSNNSIQRIMDQTAQKQSARKVTSEMGKDQFLNLLVTQLRYQDPLKPVDDKEFLGQLAQFSSLEQMQNLNNVFQQSQAYNMIGMVVKASVTDDKSTIPRVIQGTVSSITVNKGKAMAIINGEQVPVEKITDVLGRSSDAKNNLADYAKLVGYQVNGSVYDGTNGSILPVTGTVSAVEAGAHEDYAVLDGATLNVRAYKVDGKVISSDLSTYLTNNQGKSVNLIAYDPATGKEVPVTATLKSFTTNGNIVSATLDKLQIPVDSVSRIMK